MGTGAEKPQPKYRQLKDALVRYLTEEHYVADQRIPTEHALIAKFQVSRGTIRQALGELENEGILYKIQGSGTFFSGNLASDRKSSHLLGVITPMISHYIYPQIIQGITDVAQQKRYHVVLGSSHTSPGDEKECIEHILTKGVDGLIFEPAPGFHYDSGATLFNFLKTLTIPIVFMGADINDADLSYVSLDDVEGGFRATNYLIAAGHRRIACIYPTSILAGLQRCDGYRKALETSGIAYDSRFDRAMTLSNAEEIPQQTPLLIRELLELGSGRPTAVVFFDDLIAMHGCKTLQETGLRIPDNISVISFDDSELALQLALTSLAHPKYYLGKWAAELLFEKLNYPEQRFPRHLLITPTLTVRNSVKKMTG